MGLWQRSSLSAATVSALTASAIACVACGGGQQTAWPRDPDFETRSSESPPAPIESRAAAPSDSAPAPARGHAARAPAGASEAKAPSDAGAFNRWPTLPDDQFELAQRYAVGNGVPRDPDRAAYLAFLASVLRHAAALEWLSRRAKDGDTAARLWLGALQQTGTPAERQQAAELFAQVLPVIRNAADKGDATAQYQFGLMHGSGLGVAKDAVQARQWFERAALQGHALAQVAIAHLYSDGEGGPKDLEKAADWWQRAADQQDAAAQLMLGRCYRDGLGREKDPAQAFRWFLASAAQGNAVGQFNAGLMLSRGEGVAQDAPAARAMYAKAVAQRDRSAQNNLGHMHENGEGGPVDLREAARLYRLSAEAGDDTAPFNLGRLYRDGLGVPLDLEQAKAWFKKAAAKGHDGAKRELTRIEDYVRCAKIAKTELFGMKVRCATREQLRRAVARAGGTALREDDAYWADKYESARLLEESSELLLFYTRGGEFARAVYTFPSHVDAAQVTRIAEMVASKYGSPKVRKGHPEVGPVEYHWRLSDGVTLRVWRDWPDTTTYLEYVRPDARAVLNREIAANKAREKAEKNKSQAHAF